MDPATCNRYASARDWSLLPKDLLVSVLGALHVADAIRSGAVCTSWHAAYAAFRRFRVPSPKQPPCLLYASDALGPGDAALHCPSTGATLRIPFPRAPLARRPLLGSGHGWLVTADEDSDLHVVNPVTGAQVALPPITALHHVKTGTDEQGDPAYLVNENAYGEYNYSKRRFEKVDRKPTILPVHRAHDFMYYRVVLSASPSAERGDPCLEHNTTEMQLYKVDLHRQRVELITSLPEYALFLGYNASMCLPVKDFPGLKAELRLHD